MPFGREAAKVTAGGTQALGATRRAPKLALAQPWELGLGEGVEVWRGSVATWECDAMGHLNVGFYVAKSMEGLVGLAAELGMPPRRDAAAACGPVTAKLMPAHQRIGVAMRSSGNRAHR